MILWEFPSCAHHLCEHSLARVRTKNALQHLCYSKCSWNCGWYVCLHLAFLVETRPIDCVMCAMHIERHIYIYVKATTFTSFTRGMLFCYRTYRGGRIRCHSVVISKDNDRQKLWHVFVTGGLWDSDVCGNISKRQQKIDVCTDVTDAWKCSGMIINHTHEIKPFGLNGHYYTRCIIIGVDAGRVQNAVVWELLWGLLQQSIRSIDT